MPVDRDNETPLMRQYLETKDRHPDCLVFFRVGDFYELFFEDAVTAARALDLTLTSREKNRENPVPMCGVPYHAARQYLGRLVEQGYKVAVCDQVEDPRLAKGLVRREVTRVVTPGVVLDEEQLDARRGCYLVALEAGPENMKAGAKVGLALLDVSTGEFACTELAEGALDDELARIGPRELLVRPGALASLRGRTRTPVTERTEPADAKGDRELLEGLFGSLPSLGLDGSPLAVTAAAACVRYARQTQPGGTLPLTRLAVYRAADHLLLDESTQAHLELFETLAERKRRGSLIDVLDETRTSPGARLLRRWLGAPLTDVGGIRRRHDAVGWLVEHAALRGLVRAELAEVYDLERLVGRTTLGVATPRDLAALRRSLERLPGLRASLDDAAGHELAPPELLRLGLPPSLDDGGSLCEEVAADIAAALVDEPPAQWGEGGYVRRGHSAELDELVDIASGGKDQILAMEQRERERTGISSLKIRYNRVFGFYIEITRSNLARVPEGYVRKQTLANAERYVTDELSDYERKVLGAEEWRAVLEQELFVALRERVAREARRLLALAEQVAVLDVAAALAEVAHHAGYVRPQMAVMEGDGMDAAEGGGRLEIVEGRHPVVERLAAGGAGRFVPNDVRLDPDEAQLLVITGPNMAGKSTVMRQVALITLMAQAGSFVPAARARVAVVDRIFTRVGAADNLSRGESTFMVEMRETAAILRHATRRSLIVLDEIGRGTSTYDGLSIAWAVAEYLHDRVGAKTMFATHYHELVELARSRPRVRNFQVAVRERAAGEGGHAEVVFLHKLVEGGASRSYGIQVARLAGLPRAVLDRAREVLRSLESEGTGKSRLESTPQLSLFQAPVSAAPPEPTVAPAVELAERDVLDSLRAADPDALSPREAHALLCALRDRLSPSD